VFGEVHVLIARNVKMRKNATRNFHRLYGLRFEANRLGRE
jgi:hypothetical protein